MKLNHMLERMQVNSILKVVFFVLLLVLSLTTIGKQSASGKKNVLFISVDDLRPELNCYGSSHIVSPNIDRLASEGMRFTNASTQQAVCTPSRISMLLGLRQASTGLYKLEDKMKDYHPHLISFPHALKNAGYKTYSIGKIYHHNDDDPIAWTESPWRDVGSHYTKVYEEGVRPPVEANDVPDNSYPDGKIADEAIARLEQVKNEQFFIAVGFMKPHLPFTCPQKYWDLYERDQISLPDVSQPNDISPSTLQEWQELRNNYSGIPSIEEGDLDEAQTRELRHGYWACISYIDAQIGRVLDKVDELGLRENTIVVLWSDHGWKLGEYGDWCKHTNMELDVRIPFMMDVPGMESGTCGRPVESVDIYPTLMDLLDIESYPDNLEGLSMKTLLENPNAEWKKAVFAQYERGSGIMGTSMRTEDYRYTEYRNQAGNLQEFGELYDHSSYDAANPLGAEYYNAVRDDSYGSVLEEMQELMQAGWNGVRYGASLSIKSQTENSVTLSINRLPETGELKLYQRIDEGEPVEILPGQITKSTNEIRVTDLEIGKAYYFKLKIDMGNGQFNYSPELGFAPSARVSLVDNGTFSAEFSSSWTDRQYNGSSMTYGIVDGKLQASVTAPGPNTWDVGFMNKKTSSFSNKKVVFSFWAKANTNADIRITLDFNNKQYLTQNITSTWKQYTFVFENVSANALQLKMWLPTLADYEIDDIVAYYEEGAATNLDPEGGLGSVIEGILLDLSEGSSLSKEDAFIYKTRMGYTIVASEPVLEWKLIDLSGREVKAQRNLYAKSNSIDLTSIRGGTYILVINESLSFKLVW